MYYHILEYSNYGNVGYQGYELNFIDAEKKVNDLSQMFSKSHFTIFVDCSKCEPPITTI